MPGSRATSAQNSGKVWRKMKRWNGSKLENLGQVSNLANADSPSLNKYHFGGSFLVGPISGILPRRQRNRCCLERINIIVESNESDSLKILPQLYNLGIELITISLDSFEHW